MRGKPVVLHLEDDPAMRRLVSRELENRGYEVVSFGDPRELTARLLGSNARVVLLDVDLPDADGLQLIKQIRDHDGGIQVIMLTGVVSITTILQSMRAGAAACVFKPMSDFSELHAALEAAFARLEYWLGLLEVLRGRKELEEQNSNESCSPCT